MSDRCHYTRPGQGPCVYIMPHTHGPTGVVTAATVEQIALRVALRRLLTALVACEANHGRFSRVDAHHIRCQRHDRESREWRGVWRCECGAEELGAAIRAAEAALGGGR